MKLALTRDVSDSLVECALTFAPRTPIDIELARHQHEAFERVLSELGVEVVRMQPLPDHPDATFVEDTAVVLAEVAVMTAPSVPSRRGEVASVAEVLTRYRPTRFLEGEAALEGGDVIVIGANIFAGLSARTNTEGIAQLAEAVAAFDYRVHPVEFQGCLHLKSACTYIGRDTLLVNPDWFDHGQIAVGEVIEVNPAEPSAANALEIGGVVVFPDSFPKTRRRLEECGFQVQSVDISELQKAEAGVTCSAILLEA